MKLYQRAHRKREKTKRRKTKEKVASRRQPTKSEIYDGNSLPRASRLGNSSSQNVKESR